jgi:hypothetical protein
MNKLFFFPHILLASAALLSASAFAQEGMDEADSPAPVHSHPMIVVPSEQPEYLDEEAPASRETSTPANSDADIAVISGGIGEEMDHLKSIQNQYTLKLLITEENGIFLSDVAVHIEDKQGHPIVDTVTQGPVLLANLPKGTYKVVVRRRNDEVKELKVTVTPGKLHAYQVAFSNTDDRDSGDLKTTPLQ